MKKSGLLSTSAIGSAAALGLSLGFATPASAEETAAADTAATTAAQGDAAADQGEQAITVTGSRIRRPNLDAAVPVTSIQGDNVVQTADTNLGEALTELPQLRATVTQQNPALAVGVAGLNLLDLRGLGPQRTLVLVNGRRHVAGDIQGTTASVDVNSIPNDLIERVDIVTGGQSAVYGSDAIAGVVNFILRRDFQGLQLRGNVSIAQEGYGAEQYVSAMYGTNFADSRGNVTIHGEYARQERLFGSDIPAYRSVDGLAVVDVDPAGLPNGSDGIPDRVYLRNVRSATINRLGLVTVTYPIGGPAPCGISGAANAAPFNCTFLWNAQGRLEAQTGTRFGTTINGGYVGGNGQTGREDTLLSILPETERYTVNLLGRYEFSPAAELFLEAKYSRIDARGNNASPSFTQGGSFSEVDLAGVTRPADQQRERFRLDNPFLNPLDRTFLAAAFLASDCDNTIAGAACSATPTSGTRLSAAEEAQIAAGTYRFIIGKQFLDVGIRDELFRRETYRAVLGLRGTFNDDWTYEISANYGRMEETTRISGYVDRQRFLLALDAGRNPVTGQIQCRSQFEPTAAYPFQSATLTPAQNAAIRARLAADIAACIPYNPFGAPDNRASSAYFSSTAQKSGYLDQFVVSGFMSGDTSEWFELPGGPVRFAIGGEYRRDGGRYNEDPLVLQGVTNALNLGTATPPDTEVAELFGEIQIPILRDTPFFEDLRITAAGRMSDYNTIGTVYAYNAGIEWAPIRDLRFRANYGRSVRAPNFGETGFPVVPNFAPAFADPCAGANIGSGSATRAANCLADLGPALLANIASLGAPSLPVLTGSNPDLREETSDSITVGFVFQPRIIPGLSISADYYDITVNDVIVTLGAQNIANSCYDSPTLTNPFCGLFQRFRGAVGTTGPSGEIAGTILANSLLQAPLNFASRVRRGMDIQVNYRTNLTPDLRLDTNLLYVHNFQISNYQDPLVPDFEDRFLGELGDPEDEFRWDVNLTYREFTLAYQMRYIGEMFTSPFAEDFVTVQDRVPTNLDWADIREFPATFYHNIRFEWNVPGVGGRRDGLRFYVGIDNLLDTYPPLGLTGTGGTGAGNDRASPAVAAIYETQGRTLYAGFRARF